MSNTDVVLSNFFSFNNALQQYLFLLIILYNSLSLQVIVSFIISLKLKSISPLYKNIIFIINYLRPYLLLYKPTFRKYTGTCMYGSISTQIRSSRALGRLYLYYYNIILLGSNRKSTPRDSITAICAVIII